MVDDHAIDSLRVWFDIDYDELVKEWKSKEYKKLSDCPSFESVSAYRSALNILIKSLYLPEYLDNYKIQPLKRMIEEQLEIEEFWAEREGK
jgi:hypothetical protein